LALRNLTLAEIAGWIAATAAVAILPDLLSRYGIVRATLLLTYAILSISLDLIWGYAGILSFGQSALFGVGGYAYGVVAINADNTWLGLLAAVAVPSMVAAAIGYITFYGRIGAMYFSVVTLIITLILYQVMGSTADPSYAIGRALLGGYNGMTNIPSLSLGAEALDSAEMLRLVGGVMLLVLLFSSLLVRSSFGRLLQGIRENELRTEILGFDVRWRKLAAFTIAGAIAGLAGALFASWGNFISPAVFSLPQSALVVIWVLVGGRGTLFGAALGAIAVQYLAGELGASASAYTPVVFGSILLASVLMFKGGLSPVLWRLVLLTGELGRGKLRTQGGQPSLWHRLASRARFRLRSALDTSRRRDQPTSPKSGDSARPG
jgi:ABC-type branched-subunit amino acid transport system permease subunit